MTSCSIYIWWPFQLHVHRDSIDMFSTDISSHYIYLYMYKAYYLERQPADMDANINYHLAETLSWHPARYLLDDSYHSNYMPIEILSTCSAQMSLPGISTSVCTIHHNVNLTIWTPILLQINVYILFFMYIYRQYYIQSIICDKIILSINV